MKYLHSKYLPILIFIILFGGIYLIGRSIPEETIRTIVTSSGIFAPLLLFLLMLLTYIIAPISSSPFLYVGFYLYGKDIIFLSFTTSFIASIINFWIARIWGRSLVEKFAGKKTMNRVDRLTINYGLPYLFITRLFLGGEHDVVSYAAGLTLIKFYPYLIISTLASIPGTFIWYQLASQTNNPLIFTASNLGLVYLLNGIFIIGIFIFNNFKKRK
ncbi:MAG: VTT domain-containing protein [Candidatus Daviesbacteria bacterium]|nr:VTT domain-containing protein [Candidatus Daviesbacteria bacterium]